MSSDFFARARCRLGLHFWELDRPMSILDGFPMDPNHRSPIRTCTRCGKYQEWLPGYGGSEWGSWMRTQEPPK